ncbi:MAG: type I restriction endonuclease subunit R [Erysipelotrichaceae bacterium]|nr:type I restriction endonuclease subunit R [Erysipelotrichaceae bacterium]
MKQFNEDTRVKIPATFQFLRLGYSYQSLKTSDIDFDTKIFVNRFKPALEMINNKSISDNDILLLLSEIHALMRNNDLGRSFYKRLTDTTADIKLVDFDNFDNNDFAVVDELPFTIEKDTEEGSFRPDINVLINGMPLAFLEVKKPNNDGGIQEEFNRMINKRLQNPAYRKFFNFIQIVSFSNNMPYENEDNDDIEMVKAGSFYTTPNGNKTTFSFFREDEANYHNNYPYIQLDDDECREYISDLGYDPANFDSSEFKTNNVVDTPCNQFVTSVFDKERLLYIIKNGLIYIKASNDNPPEKHIMRYPQFFAARNLIRRLDKGEKRGIIWHTQGSGKTELAAYCNGIIKDYYAKKDIITRFFFVVDRLELLRQDNGEFSNRYFSVVNAQSRESFGKELNRILKKKTDDDTIGEFVVVNIQKFEEAMPQAQNAYDADIQRVFFIDEAHRSYAKNGAYFKNLILCDPNAVFIALTGTPLLSKKERSNLKFGDYIHKYFYDKSIADGYTLRIKKEKIDTVVKTEIKNNLQMEDPDLNKADVFESDPYIRYLGNWIDKDFKNFRIVNMDNSIGGMIVCRTNPQAKKLHDWFHDNSSLSTGLVISDEGNPLQSEANKNNQKEFKYDGRPDLLIVEYMLTTGYDVSRLKKMYLLRGPHAQNLLQTISRVNRPYKSPNGKVYHYGYITDFVDIEEEYDRTLEDYLKELEADINIGDEDGEHNSLAGLVVDVNSIREKYNKYLTELNNINNEDDLEKFSQKLTWFTKQILLKIKHQLNGIKDCYVEFMLSNAMEDAAQIDFDLIKKKLRLTQERIDFINLQESPVRMLEIISDEEVVEIVYEFIKTSISIIDLGKFNPDDPRYVKFTDTLTKVKAEINKNRNKSDIKMVNLDAALQILFSRMNMMSIDDLDSLTEEMRELLAQAIAINAENERLASIYDGNFALVKTYQDIIVDRPELDNKDIEAAVQYIYSEIKEGIDTNILIVQGREGFIDEAKKKVVKGLLKAGLYKKLNLKDWIQKLLSDLYTNLQNFR